MKPNPIAARPFLYLLIGVVLISFSPILVTLSAAPALRVGFYRNAFGLVFLLLMVLGRKDKWGSGKWSVLLPLIAGVFFFLDLWGWHTAIGFIGPGLATLLGNFQVFFVMLFSAVFLRERLSAVFLFSVMLALFGVYLLSQSPAGEGDHQTAGVLLGLLAAVCYAIFLMINRKAQSMGHKVSAEMNLVYVTVSTGMLFAAAMGVSGESFQLETKREFWVMLAYGFFPHFVGWIIIIRCLPLVKASVAGIALLLQPVFSFAWEVIIFGKQFQPMQLLGGVLVVAAIYAGTIKERTPKE